MITRPLITVLTTAVVAFAIAACTTTETTETDQSASAGTTEIARAGMTPWLGASEAHSYARQSLVPSLYPTKIECRPDDRDWMAVRFHIARTTPETKPFHKWQFVMTEPGGIEAAVAAIRLRDRPDLRYRVISRDRAGTVGECAVAYR